MKNAGSILIIVLCSLAFNCVAQENFKDKYRNKFSTLKDTLSSNAFKIKGRISFSSSLNYAFPEHDLTENYKLAAQINLNYKGVDIPIQYILTNGRSINRFNGPSFRTPKFNIAGISPSYKWATLHLGDRTMSFSKYTYENLRFKGIGLELAPGPLYFRSFKGNLSPLTPLELNFVSNYKPIFNRKTWGSQLGYANERLDISTIIFTANDDYRNIKYNPENISLPKENTAVSIKGTLNPKEHIEIKFERSISALTHNSYDERIDIKTQSTIYNMLGLFTKKASSEYNYAGNISIDYKKEKFSIGLGHETIDKNYRSLGSLLYDNNFRHYTINGSFSLREKFQSNNTIGLRESKSNSQLANSNSRFILNSNASYQINKKHNVNASFSNFQQSENLYLRSQNSAQIDSVILSNVNRSISLGYNMMLGDSTPTSISIMASNQISNTIQFDSLELGSKTVSNILGVTVSKSINNHNLTLSTNYSNNTGSVSSKVISSSLSHKTNVGEKFSLRNSIVYSYVTFGENPIHQVNINNSLTYNIDQNKNLSLESRVDFSDSNRKFEPFTYYSGIQMNYIF